MRKFELKNWLNRAGKYCFRFYKKYLCIYEKRKRRAKALRPPKNLPLIIRRGEQQAYTHELMGMINKLEQEWATGPACLQLTMMQEKVSRIAGKPILNCYQRLIDLRHRPSTPFRQSNIQWLLKLYEPIFAQPKKAFPATAITKADRYGRRRFKGISVETGDQTHTLSLEQVLRASKWGVEFDLNDSDQEDWIATHQMRRHVDALASDIQNLQSIEIITKIKRGDLRIIPGLKGYLFEEMMIDILNEHRPTTRRAPLLEDFSEKTDLRYRVPELKRKKGARIQVTYTIKPEHLQKKLAQIKHRAEYIILSPLTLAQALNQEPQALSEHLDLQPIWDCVEKSATVKELAISLREVFFNAMNRGHEHPLGPIAFIPAPIKQLIQTYVHTEAFRTTHLLRVRERKTGQFRSIETVKRKKQRKWLQAQTTGISR